MSDRPIVVGYDASEGSRAALCWALTEARMRNSSVHLVHVLDAARPPAVLMSGPAERSETGPRAGAEAAVERVAASAAESRPQVPVSWVVLDGNPAGRLCEVSEQAEMIVLAQRGAGGFDGLTLGSVAVAVAAHAHCPVVVVRGDQSHLWPPPPVVVGVDDSPVAQSVVGFAVEEAGNRSVDLVAVRAWNPPAPPWHTITRRLVYDVDELETTERRVLDQALEGWRDKYPDVRMDTRLAPSSAVRALVAASREAQLVVVGPRGRGGFAGLVLGSVSQQLLHHAHCPVAVVR
jgi:nucleotide-binding universal stress UspA family protein